MDQRKRGLEETKAAWQDSYPYELTDEDAIEIDKNLLAFITVLLKWEREDQLKNTPPE